MKEVTSKIIEKESVNGGSYEQVHYHNGVRISQFYTHANSYQFVYVNMCSSFYKLFEKYNMKRTF